MKRVAQRRLDAFPMQLAVAVVHVRVYVSTLGDAVRLVRVEEENEGDDVDGGVSVDPAAAQHASPWHPAGEKRTTFHFKVYPNSQNFHSGHARKHLVKNRIQLCAEAERDTSAVHSHSPKHPDTSIFVSHGIFSQCWDRALLMEDSPPSRPHA